MLKYVSFAATAGILLMPLFATAATISINPNIPGVESPTDLVSIVVNFYQFALLTGAVLAFASIVYGAVNYALSESVGTKNDAKDRIVDAFIGLVLLAGAYLLLYTINPALTIFTNPGLEKLPEITSQSGTSGSGNVNECAGVPSTGCVFKPDTTKEGCKDAQKVIGKTADECKAAPNPTQCYQKIDCKPRSTACTNTQTDCKGSLNKVCAESGPVQAVLSCLGCPTTNGFRGNCTAKGTNLGSLYTFDGHHNMCSCHFGGDGRSPQEGSHAIDFGNEQLGNQGIQNFLKTACNIDTKCVTESDHIHCYFGPNAKQEYGCW